jgi:hypothetical protein
MNVKLVDASRNQKVKNNLCETRGYHGSVVEE